MDNLRIRAAKPVAGITVTGANPDSATQDTTLDVAISGSGFSSDAIARWAFRGVEAPLQVRTNSTRYVNSGQLVANITISADAALGDWDIIVMAGPKSGIGTESFTVKTKSSDTNSRVNYTLADEVDVAAPGGSPDVRGAGIRGDGRLRDGLPKGGQDSEYQSRFCGSTGSITNMLTPSGQPGDGHAFFNPADGVTPCGAWRYFLFDLDGVSTQLAPDSRIPSVWAIGVGQTVAREYRIGVGLQNCFAVAFNSALGGDDVTLTRQDAGTGPRQWLVKSSGQHRAACVNLTRVKGKTAWTPTGKKYVLPFRMVLTEVLYPPPSFP